jgi:dipeptide/tripeptide permease
MGINLGSLTAPLLTGYLQTRISFHAGFLVSGLGTLRPANPKFFLRLIA